MAAGETIDNRREVSAIVPVLYVTIPTYLLMACIGLGSAILFIYRRRAKMHLELKVFAEFLLLCVILGFVNARILFVLAMIPSMQQITINELFYQLMNGGIVFYGGLFGVIAGIVVVSKYRKMNAAEMLDFAAPAFPLFHAFARFGCLLAGCCHGIEWNWGVVMADEPDVIRFPVQLFESICDLLIFLALLLLENKRKSSKYNLSFYLCTYAACRFVLEFYRGDEIRGVWSSGLSTAQYISVLILIYYGINLGIRIKKSGLKACKMNE